MVWGSVINGPVKFKLCLLRTQFNCLTESIRNRLNELFDIITIIHLQILCLLFNGLDILVIFSYSGDAQNPYKKGITKM